MQGTQNMTQTELQYITDCLETEKKAIENYTAFARETRDPEVSEICKNVANKHQQHYNTLLQHLQNTSHINTQ